MENIRCVVVGDRNTGKFSLITSCTIDALPGVHISNIKGSLSKQVNTRRGQVTLNFRYNTKTDDDECDIDIFRDPLYKNVDVVLICFSIANPTTFKSIISKWKVKLRDQIKSVPIVLVGTKLDLRDDPGTIKKLKEKKLTPISHEQGAAMAREINARVYIECSALSRINMGVVTNQAVKVALMRRSRICNLL